MRSHDVEWDRDVEVPPRKTPHAPDEPSAGADALGPLSTDNLLRLQRTAGNAAVTELVQRSPVLEVVESGGQPMEPAVRTDMETRFGQSFGDVRVHTGQEASASTEAVGAHAYTVGRDMVFRSGTYNPGSDDGRTLIAHELTHVVQQREGAVTGTPAPGGIEVSDPGDRYEQEAEATASAVMSGPDRRPDQRHDQ